MLINTGTDKTIILTTDEQISCR